MLCLLAIKDSPIIPAIIALIGILIGFFLGEISGWIRGRRRMKKLKKGLDLELNSILVQIPWTKSFVEGVIKELENGKIADACFVKFPTIGYKSSIAEIYTELNDTQRRALHAIYGNIEVTEKFLDSFKKDLQKDLGEYKLIVAMQSYLSTLKTMYENYDRMEQYIKDYLSGAKVDPFTSEIEKT